MKDQQHLLSKMILKRWTLDVVIIILILMVKKIASINCHYFCKFRDCREAVRSSWCDLLKYWEVVESSWLQACWTCVLFWVACQTTRSPFCELLRYMRTETATFPGSYELSLWARSMSSSCELGLRASLVVLSQFRSHSIIWRDLFRSRVGHLDLIWDSG